MLQHLNRDSQSEIKLWGETQKGKTSTEGNTRIEQLYFQERLVVKWIQQKAGKDFSFSDGIFSTQMHQLLVFNDDILYFQIWGSKTTKF